MQGSRLDDQRCSMPSMKPNTLMPSRQRLENILQGSPPYPLVSLPPGGGFWCDPTDNKCSQSPVDIEYSESLQSDMDESPSRKYRAHFFQSEHFNFCGHDNFLGPVVLSMKYYYKH